MERKEQESLTIQREKDRVFQAALESWNRGEIAPALTLLERLLDLERRSPGPDAEHDAYLRLCEQVRGAAQETQAAYDYVMDVLRSGNYKEARAVTNRILERYPNLSQFLLLQIDIDEQQRQSQAAFVAEVERNLVHEVDLDRRVVLLQEALERCPGEPRLEAAFESARSRRDLIGSIASRARDAERRGHFADALNEWEQLRRVYPLYRGLDEELQRVRRRRAQQIDADHAALERGEVPVLPPALRTAASAQSRVSTETPLSHAPSRSNVHSGPDSVYPAALPAEHSRSVFAIFKRNIWVSAATLLGSIVLFVAVAKIVKGPSNPTKNQPSTAVVELVTNPENVQVSFQGKDLGTTPLAVPMPVGVQELQFSRPGYQPQTVKVNVGAGMQPVTVSMLPLAPFLRVVLGQGKVTVDGTEIPLRDSSAVQAITPGEHQLEVSDGANGHVSLRFRLDDAGLPTVLPGLRVSGVLATVAAAFHDQARVYWPRRAGFDAQLQAVDPAAGLLLTNLAPGTLDLLVSESTQPRRVPIDVTPSKTLQVIVTDINTGTLMLAANQEGATVLIDGRAMRRPITQGAWTGELTPGPHKVKVTKDGFQDEPEQTVDIQKGAVANISFNLKPAVMLATLRITNGTEEADVQVDGARVGATDKQGRFESDQITPGSHRITLSKPLYEPATQAVEFPPRGVVEVKLKLEPFGTVEVTRVPETLKVLYWAENETQSHPLTGSTLRLRKGAYLFSAGDLRQRVEVKPGQTSAVQLRAPEKPKPEKTEPVAGGGLERFSGVKEEQGEWMVLKQGAMFNGRPQHVSFSARRRGGFFKKRKISWYIRYVDARNYSYCEMDDKEVDCQDVKEGATISRSASKHNLGKFDTVSVDVAFSADGEVRQRLSSPEGGSASVDPVRPELPADAARFGFRGETQVKDVSVSGAR